ncbi:MAG: hypothetical protein R3232_06255, partial [Clostridia bacterium]|nr:hypothetical protein [Clostridia bacterium]
MIISLNGFSIDLAFILRFQENEIIADPKEKSAGYYSFECNSASFDFILEPDGKYRLGIKSEKPASLKILITIDADDIYHLIPCNIHGDNNLRNAEPGFFPNLTYEFPEYDTSSDEWEFRADRASHPVSIMTFNRGAVGISINPYSDSSGGEGGFIRNGVISKLPNSAGVSLGYTNFPCTFTSKENMTESTRHLTTNASATGKIYAVAGKNRTAAASIIKEEYYKYRDCPSPSSTILGYLEGFLYSYEHINWSEEHNAFTNEECRIPGDPELKPWRPLLAIGWTGTGVLAYPLL